MQASDPGSDLQLAWTQGRLWPLAAYAIAAYGVIAMAALLFQPSLPNTIWYGQWTPRLGQFTAYEGTVQEASIGGMPLPSHRLPQQERYETALVGNDVETLIERCGARVGALRLDVPLGTDLVLDLGSLRFCDLRGLDVLTDTVEAGRSIGVPVTVTNAPPALERVRHLLGARLSWASRQGPDVPSAGPWWGRSLARLRTPLRR